MLKINEIRLFKIRLIYQMPICSPSAHFAIENDYFKDLFDALPCVMQDSSLRPHSNVDNSNNTSSCIHLGDIVVFKLMQIRQVFATHCFNNDYSSLYTNSETCLCSLQNS